MHALIRFAIQDMHKSISWHYFSLQHSYLLLYLKHHQDICITSVFLCLSRETTLHRLLFFPSTVPAFFLTEEQPSHAHLTHIKVTLLLTTTVPPYVLILVEIGLSTHATLLKQLATVAHPIILIIVLPSVGDIWILICLASLRSDLSFVCIFERGCSGFGWFLGDPLVQHAVTDR